MSSASYPIPLRELGRTGKKIPAIGFGAMSLSNIYGPADDAKSKELLLEAIKLGCTFWDTADIYGLGHNERLVGEVLKEHRDKVFLCTKFGMNLNKVNPQDVGKSVLGNRDYVLAACNASLERLGVDYIDLYYQHRVDITVPIEETMGALKELMEAGKIKHIGLSECSKETLERALKVARVEAVEIEYSPWETGPEVTGLLQLMREHGISLIAYSPLGRGMVTGELRSLDQLAPMDFRRTIPRFSPENFPLNLRLTDRMIELARIKEVTPAAYCLAWILYQGDDFFVIPGTKSLDRLKENLESARVLQSFTDVDDKAVRVAIEEFGVIGERYHPDHMPTLGN